MNGELKEAQLRRRMEEMARRCEATGIVCFSGFLSPPEGEWAMQAGRKAGVYVTLNGGYADAERRMACFSSTLEPDVTFPLCALRLTWPHQAAPQHRDLLGSIMGLGLQRRCVGDIVVEAEQAFVFAETRMADHLKAGLVSAGKIRLQVEIADELPKLARATGKEVRDTVASPRLDAVLAAGFGLSRTRAAEMIQGGHVKLAHLPQLRTDAQVSAGDVISVRGYGRMAVKEIGSPTKKGRFPLIMLRYGVKE